MLCIAQEANNAVPKGLFFTLIMSRDHLIQKCVAFASIGYCEIFTSRLLNYCHISKARKRSFYNRGATLLNSLPSETKNQSTLEASFLAYRI